MIPCNSGNSPTINELKSALEKETACNKSFWSILGSNKSLRYVAIFCILITLLAILPAPSIKATDDKRSA